MINVYLAGNLQNIFFNHIMLVIRLQNLDNRSQDIYYSRKTECVPPEKLSNKRKISKHCRLVIVSFGNIMTLSLEDIKII